LVFRYAIRYRLAGQCTIGGAGVPSDHLPDPNKQNSDALFRVVRPHNWPARQIRLPSFSPRKAAAPAKNSEADLHTAGSGARARLVKLADLRLRASRITNQLDEDILRWTRSTTLSGILTVMYRRLCRDLGRTIFTTPGSFLNSSRTEFSHKPQVLAISWIE
jgi:hypothetical protein